MKTRQEMLYDFMLALAPNVGKWEEDFLEENGEVAFSEVSEILYAHANSLTNIYLESIC
jgi:hypothetical protein